MTQQLINLGAAPNDGTGDTLRIGGQKINQNFAELYSSTSGYAMSIAQLYSQKLDSGNATWTGNMNAGGFRLENLGNPDSQDDAFPLSFGDGRYVRFASDHAINAGGRRLEGLLPPDSDDDAATKAYADSLAAGSAADLKTNVADNLIVDGFFRGLYAAYPMPALVMSLDGQQQAGLPSVGTWNAGASPFGNHAYTTGNVVTAHDFYAYPTIGSAFPAGMAVVGSMEISVPADTVCSVQLLEDLADGTAPIIAGPVSVPGTGNMQRVDLPAATLGATATRLRLRLTRPSGTGQPTIAAVQISQGSVTRPFVDQRASAFSLRTALNSAVAPIAAAAAGLRTDMNTVLASGTTNIWQDPFGQELALRPLLSTRTAPAYAGTINATDTNSPWGLGSVAASSGTAQRKQQIADMGLKPGDTVTIRSAMYFGATSGAATVFFRDASGTVTGSLQYSATVLAVGVNDVAWPPQTIPPSTVMVEVRATQATASILAVAAANGSVKPAFSAAPPSVSTRNRVNNQKNLWPDPFLRQYAAGIRFHNGWTFAQIAGATPLPIVTTNAASIHPGKQVIRFPSGVTGTRDMNVDARRLGLRAGDTATFVLDVYSAQSLAISVITRDANGAVVGTITTVTYVYTAAGMQTLRMTIPVTQTMVDSASFFQIRLFASGFTVGATPIEIWGRGIFVNDTQPILYDDCYAEDMAAVEQSRFSGFGYARMRESHKRLMERLLGANSQLVIALIGDSYTHLPQRYSGPFATYMQGKYGDAGYGFIGFANPDAGLGNINGNAWKGLTITTVGTWATSYTTGYGPDIGEVTATGSANIYKINFLVAGAGLAINILGRPVSGASYDYSLDNGLTWATVDASTGTNINSNAVAGLPASGTFTLWIRPNAGSPIFYGLSATSTTSGVRVCKLGSTGSSAAQWAARVIDARWQASLVALAPNACIVMLGTNDQSSSTAPNVFGGYIRTIIASIQATVPLADILVMVAPENMRTSNVELAAYASVVREIARETGVTFRWLQQDYGLQPSDYGAVVDFPGARGWFTSKAQDGGVHPDPTTNGGFPIVDAARSIFESHVG